MIRFLGVEMFECGKKVSIGLFGNTVVVIPAKAGIQTIDVVL